MLPAETILIIIILLVIFFILNQLIVIRIKKQLKCTTISEKWHKTIFDTVPEAIIITEARSGKIISFNSLAARTFNLKSEQTFINDIFYNAGNNRAELNIPISAKKLKGLFCSTRINNNFTFSISSTEILLNGENCILSIVRDITENIKTENALRESEQRYRELTDMLPEAVFETGPDGNFTYANKKAYELFGYESVDLNKKYSPINMVIVEEREIVKKNLHRIFTENTRLHYEYTGLHSSGRHFPILVHSTAIIRENKVAGICGIVINLTERIRIEKELQKKEKIEALGILAGGIAHDFNNLLTAIWSGLSVLKIDYPNHIEKDIINDLENAVRRGKDLTGQLLTYSKGGAPIKEITSLESIVKETAAFIMSGKKTKYEINSDDNLYTVEIDSTQISRVIQNLLINALEAMSDVGIIKINLRNKNDLRMTNSHSKKYVELIITDSGKGIPGNVRQRVFDPFFTTKQNGSGLGLATSYSIIKKHNGHIYFNTSEGNGTSFHVLIPASQKVATKKVSAENILTKVKGRILLMDDEKIILNVTQKLLEHLGYSVVLASNGDQAICSYKKALEENRKFDIVILDLTIPAGAGGKEVLSELIKIDPDINAVVSSGYSHDPVMANYKSYGFKGVICKPYNLNELSNCLSKIINSDSVSSDH